MRPSLFLASVAVVLVGIAGVVNGDCKLGDFDLSPIGTVQLSMEQDYQGASAMYTWVVNLCGPVSVPPNTATECKAKISGNVLPGYVTEYSTNNCQTSWGKLTGNSAGYNAASISLGQTDDSNHPLWTANIYLACGQTVTLTPVGNVNVTGANAAALNFDFHFTTSQVCNGVVPPPPGGPTGAEEPPACGGGCAFVIVVFVGAFVYVVVTVLFFYIQQGKRGLELIPHAEFWKDFASLIKEGVVFSVQKIRALICKSGPYAGEGSSYQQV